MYTKAFAYLRIDTSTVRKKIPRPAAACRTGWACPRADLDGHLVARVTEH